MPPTTMGTRLHQLGFRINMNINVRPVSNYRNVTVTVENTKVDLGMLDPDQCMELAIHLRAAITDLLTEEQLATLDSQFARLT